MTTANTEGMNGTGPPQPVPPLRRRLALGGFLVVCFLVSGLGGLATSASVGGWYQTLVRPPLNPPDWVFAPVWTTLFVLMAIAAWRVWLHGAPVPRKRALRLFWVQLALNLLWSVLFFALQSIGLALIEIVMLLAAIVATLIAFSAIDRTAAWLLVPYAAWVSFATYLNAALWWLN